MDATEFYIPREERKDNQLLIFFFSSLAALRETFKNLVNF